jgi:hypothetical protein
MMAKMFYTLDEAQAALGKNEEEIKQLAREGRLREFRDGPRLMFKADQVDALRSELSGGGPVDNVDLGPSDSGAPIGLVDSKGASGSGISLVDSDAGGSRSGIQPLKDDTALAADLGLSGSIGGVPSPGRPSQTLSGSGLSVSKGGINVFGEDSVAHADPMAQTAISQGINDQVNLEGVGSGSGLLDLTRESDDTSLGAELLDEIAPGKGRVPGESRAGTGVAAAVGETRIARGGMVTYQEVRDPMAGAFGGAALAAALFMLVGGLVLTSGVVGTRPSLVNTLSQYNFWVLFGIGAGLAVVFAIVGMIVGRAAR